MMVKFVKNCLDGQTPSYLSNYFQQQTYDVHAYSFIRALPILYNFIPVSNTVFIYTELMLIAVFITEMVILLKYVKYVLLIIITTEQRADVSNRGLDISSNKN